VLQGTAVRTTLFVGVALYAWATIWLLERWRARRAPTLVSVTVHKETPA
jgi:hypothetical protein